MANQTETIIIGVSVGGAAGVLISFIIFILLRCYLKHSRKPKHDEERTASTLPMRINDGLASTDSSVSNLSEPPSIFTRGIPRPKRVANGDAIASASRISTYSYKFALQAFFPSSWIASKCKKSKIVMSLSSREIEKATQSFTTIVGQGSFGTVYKAVLASGDVVAVKVLAANSRQGEKEFHTEVLLLSRLHHPNLVNLVGFCVERGQFMLVYEFMSNGSLAAHLYGEGGRSLTWEERLKIALDISLGIRYLQEGVVPPVIHRDLKSANILLDGSLTAKVADFGLSGEQMGLNRRSSGLKGTYGYMDPDYVSTNVISTKSDIYSFGIILFELITAINPQQGLLEYINLALTGGDEKADWDEILDKRLAGNCHLDEVQLLADVAYKCLQAVPRKRPAISEISNVILRIKGRRRRHVGEDEDGAAILERIQAQQIELSQATARRENLAALCK